MLLKRKAAVVVNRQKITFLMLERQPIWMNEQKHGGWPVYKIKLICRQQSSIVSEAYGMTKQFRCRSLHHYKSLDEIIY